MTMTPGHLNDRSILRFPEEVKGQFSFLETRGFRRKRAGPTLVRYQSPMMGVNIYHGRQSFEVGLEIDSISSPTVTYSFSEILCLVDREKDEQYKNYATHTAQGVAEGVGQLANLLQRCVAAGLLEDKQLFTRLKTQRGEIAKAYALETQLETRRRCCPRTMRVMASTM